MGDRKKEMEIILDIDAMTPIRYGRHRRSVPLAEGIFAFFTLPVLRMSVNPHVIHTSDKRGEPTMLLGPLHIAPRVSLAVAATK